MYKCPVYKILLKVVTCASMALRSAKRQAHAGPQRRSGVGVKSYASKELAPSGCTVEMSIEVRKQEAISHTELAHGIIRGNTTEPVVLLPTNRSRIACYLKHL